MNWKFKLGDRVRIKSKDYATGEIESCDLNYMDLPIYTIKFFEYVLDPFNATHRRSKEEDIELDLEYYRDEKLNAIL